MANAADIDLSKVDLYDFLSLPGPAATSKEINRAGRQTSFRYHPDKVAATPENLEKFHLAQIAISILSDSAEKTKYDQQREAKLRRKAEVDALDDRRRKMAADLESRESAGGTNVVAGQKRTFSEREMKIRRAQEENRRKVEERNTRIKLDAEQKAARDRAEATKEAAVNGDASATAVSQATTNGETGDSDSNTSVRIRWLREGKGLAYDENTVRGFLGEEVEEVVLLKDKKRRVDGQKSKVMMGVAVAIFATRKAAEEGIRKCKLSDDFDSAEWMKSASADNPGKT